MKINPINNNSELRFEKKWIYRRIQYYQLLTKLLRSNFKFKFQHKNRLVNSIYFDNHNFSNVRDNIDGEKNRLKYRLRWYGSKDYVSNPSFEIKYKSGMKTLKKREILKINKKISLKNIDNFEFLKNYIVSKNFNKDLYQPKIHISYLRTYLISSNNLIRATIDQDIKFKKLNQFNKNFFYNFNNIVLEMKYDLNLDVYFRNEINQIFSRYSKSSKYINCMLIPSKEFSI